MVSMKTYASRKEWLEARTSYIGGSDASAVVGMNPYMNNIELWNYKTGKAQPHDISFEDFVKYGHDAEMHLRELFRLDYPRYEVLYEDNNMWTNTDYPFAHASLDGWLVDKATGRKGILEIKTTNILQSMQKEKWNHRIPDNYYIQVLHYLMVTEFDFAILKAQLKYEYADDIFLTTKHYMIERSDVEEDIKYLANAEQRFAENIRNNKKPALILPNI